MITVRECTYDARVARDLGAEVGLPAASRRDVLRHRARGGDLLPRRGLPRGHNSSYDVGTFLTIHVMAVAAGAKDLKEVHAFAGRLTNDQLVALGCPWAKDVDNRPVAGDRRTCPSSIRGDDR